MREWVPSSHEEVLELMQHYTVLNVPRPPGDVFLAHMTRKDCWFVEVGDIGLIYLSDIIPAFSAQIHTYFWDMKLPKERVIFVRSVLCAAFELFQCRRIAAATSKMPMHRFLKEVGFVHEGALRDAFVLGEGKFEDLHILSVLREEATWQPLTISSAL